MNKYRSRVLLLAIMFAVIFASLFSILFFHNDSRYGMEILESSTSSTSYRWSIKINSPYSSKTSLIYKIGGDTTESSLLDINIESGTTFVTVGIFSNGGYPVNSNNCDYLIISVSTFNIDSKSITTDVHVKNNLVYPASKTLVVQKSDLNHDELHLLLWNKNDIYSRPKYSSISLKMISTTSN